MSFTNMILTAGGKVIYAKGELGNPIHFSRVAIGDGVLTGPIPSRTALVNERMSLAIDGKRLVSGGTETAIITTMDNRDLNDGFYYREVGIFAIDPETGAELLCLYDNAGADAEEIPPGRLSPVYERLVFILNLDASKEITFNWSGNPLYPTVDEFEAEIARIDSDLQVLREDISPIDEKVAPDDADSVVLADSTADGKKKRFTWANLVTAMKTDLGALFAPLVHSHTMEQITGLIACLSNKLSNINHYATPTDALSPLGDGRHRCATWTNLPPWESDAQAYVAAWDWLVEDGVVAYGRRHATSASGGKTWENICVNKTWTGWKELPNATDLSKKADKYPYIGQIPVSAQPDQYPQGITFAELTGGGAIPGLAVTFQGVNEWRTLQIIGMQDGAPHFRVNTGSNPATWTDLDSLATSAELSKKANVDDTVIQLSGYMTQAEFDDQSPETSYIGRIGPTVIGMHKPGHYDVFYRKYDDGYAVRTLTEINVAPLLMYVQVLSNGTWIKSSPIATASDLEEKANWNDGFLQSGSILEWAESKSINTNISINNAVTGTPYPGFWGINLYIYPPGGWRLLTAVDILAGGQYYIIKNNSNPWPEKWTPIATSADMPQIITGSYTGTMTDANRVQHITLGQQPKVVIVWNNWSSNSNNQFEPYFGMAVAGCSGNGIGITATGFTVQTTYDYNGSVYPSLNGSGRSYMYLAIC